MKKFTIVTAALYLFPLAAFAQLSNVNSLLTTAGRIITNTVIPIVIALAVLYFFWGLANYILATDDQKKRDDGKHIMIWGIVALFVMTSVWGLTRYLGDALGIRDGEPAPNIDLPNTPGAGF